MHCRLFRSFVLVVLMLVTVVPAVAQNQVPQQSNKSQPMDPQVERDRRYAMELYEKGDTLAALPWFEKLAEALPLDGAIQEKLAMCIYAHAETLKTLEERKAERLRANKAVLRAKELGNNSDMMKLMLEELDSEGADPKYSIDAGVDDAMRRGEKAFGTGKLDDAKRAYLQALLLNPKEYKAALYVGDVYFAKKEYGAACEWFSRTVAIDPERETGHRYWADALMMMGKYSEARAQYIEAVVADPYNQRVWMGISKFSKWAKAEPTWYKFKSPNSFSVKDEKNVNITLDAGSLDKKDGSTAWMMYDMERATWPNEKFKKEFPEEKEYRHSLKEEAEALSLVATVALESTKEKKLNEELKALVRLQKAGFIEAYVLLNGADQGIAKDYLFYREKHKDVLVRYLSEVVVPPVPKE